MVASITKIVKKSDGMMDGWNVIKFRTKKSDTSLPKYSEIQIEGENWDDELEPFCNEKYCGAIPETLLKCI